ncbi:hypothetical protein TRFO_16933 [Tritrichomonas foetus]|uniref:Protein kinase domain-containing protein n=1 Tax=Tritrichomonas foetus TaxID=1144522 RepID=A0A1J4KQ07_9EUKA|nr:hypothetical protein TRFO_16933 [Tritrichomonas foetus]|eukprot:OHT12984.1 hypothetical protein TRFO_16933 [Tritrichomonas foetus]
MKKWYFLIQNICILYENLCFYFIENSKGYFRFIRINVENLKSFSKLNEEFYSKNNQNQRMNEDDFYSNCKKIELIKRGPLSTVYLARRLAPADKSKTDNDEIFILKEIFLNPKKNLKIEDIKVSVQAMQTISHPSIHKIFGFNEGDRELFQPPRIYSQYACFRSLDLINPSNLGKHWQTIRMKIIYGVAFAMNLLHCYKPSFIHNDLRPEHILLNEKYEPLLTGFGFPKNYYLHRYVKRYTSPDILKEENENSAIEESLNSHKVDQTCESKPENDYECEEIDKNDIEFQKSCDVFSYGMVLAFLFSGNNPPFAEIADEDTAARIIASGSKLKLPNTTPKPYKKLIRSCTNVHWKKRPKFFDILYKLDTPDFKLPRIDEDEFLEYRKNMVTCKPVVIHTNESHDEIDKLQLVPADKYINKLVEQVSHGHNHGHCNGHCNGNCHCSINRTANTILTVNAQKGHVNTGKKNDERRKSIQLTRPPLPITAKPNTIN